MNKLIFFLVSVIILFIFRKNTALCNNISSHNENVIQLYEKTNKFWFMINEKNQLWKNLGYMKKNNYSTYSKAGENLAFYLGKKAGLNNNSIILDVGCGYGTQDKFFNDKFKVKKIDAISITPIDIYFANKLYKKNNITFICQDACNLNNFLKNHYTHVISLESAFHFNTRELFLKQAYNVLQKDGKIALADIIFNDTCETSELWQVPIQNIYSKNNYYKILKNIGFNDIKFECINDDIFIKNVSWNYVISTCLSKYKYIDFEMLDTFYKVFKVRYTKAKNIDDGYYIITAKK